MVYGDQPQIQSPDQISKDASKYFKAIFSKLLQKGVYLGPSGFEVGFVSAAHSDEILDEAANKINTALDEVNIEYNLS